MSSTTTTFPALLQGFFLDRLTAQKGASPRTLESYRDTFTLLLGFAERRIHHPPSEMTIADLDAPLVLAFLDHLEEVRGNGPRTRNARLTAIRSFMRYASVQDPTCLAVAHRVRAIASKRFDRPSVEFLSQEEMSAVLDAPDRTTWSGRRDAVLLATLYNTGARVSEITRLRVDDVLLDRESALHLHGKGRKERVVPLWKSTIRALRSWLRERGGPDGNEPVFPNRRGGPLSRSGVESRLRLAVSRAAVDCPTLTGRRISPHTIRHTTAMHLLQSGVDITVIALWLGHEDPATTHLYIEADLAMKERALLRARDPKPRRSRYRPGDRLLAFLESL